MRLLGGCSLYLLPALYLYRSKTRRTYKERPAPDVKQITQVTA